MRPGGVRLFFMRVIAVIMGLFSGALVMVIVDMVRQNPVWSDAPSALTLLLTIGIGWGFTVWLMLRDARGILAVIQRGFLLAVAEWIVAGALFIVLGSGAIPTPGAAREIPRASWEPSAARILEPGAIMGSATTMLAALCLACWGAAFILERIHRRSVARDLSRTRP